MARELLFMKAINEALDMAMAKDDKIILLGEDIAGGVKVKHLEEQNEEAWGVGRCYGGYQRFNG